MKQKMYEVNQQPKKNNRKFKVEIDLTSLPSPVHKYGALNNKAVRFEDKRKKQPKYKPVYSY